MSEQAAPESAQPLVPAVPAVKLWSPNFIFAVGFFLGFPAGVILAFLNWRRMNLEAKARISLWASAAGALIWAILIYLLSSSAGRLLGIVVNIGAAFYVRQQIADDMKAFKAANPVENAQALSGCLIGILGLVLFLILSFLVALVLGILGVPSAS